ncbi:tRNA pseudouridine(65) synthase TruC [Kingella kingae]|uniref:tRNA pseudouridine(65) synthase TruC n=1 Tax=Kingella kingae TaxID=504 RepID=UPI00041B5E20|nr:tRNA pseudouridine(65) synthase TruC [Kingella kingae]MBD3613047.1 tRNA pseudouridine(65) synthase TruC [Kingella kingae]MBD3631405.1 tRNA pseudouridine(65) synthase TruC [Kingella kingae]MBD3658713.1 tRNA pseudouridine(65) synthase TruC [Kingella kingae]MDK4529471.1 tRNA pseudouridine(65) synthase TruC [Kingella kingae]MDK4579675.1 tRNA pseudouridine(65) synthase TruC [Kingella kingae]
MIEILTQTEHYVVVNKPAGMLVHRSRLDSQETVFLMQTLRDQLGQLVYPVHRLDKPTSGAMLWALNSEAARWFTQQFEQKQIRKHYLAIVRGWTENVGCIDYPLKEQLDKIADMHAQSDKTAQAACTEYQTLQRSECPFASSARYATSRYSLLHITLKTGRKHQIRRHMKHIFHPIVGDTTHGDLHQNQAVNQFCGNRRLLLHASSLHFADPISQQNISIHAPTDSAWQQTQAALFAAEYAMMPTDFSLYVE